MKTDFNATIFLFKIAFRIFLVATCFQHPRVSNIDVNTN